MTRAEFDAAVTAVGADKVIGIVFDNGAKETFHTYDGTSIFSLASADFMVFKHNDLNGVPYRIIKDIETVQGIIAIDDVEDKGKIDTRYITF